MRKEGPDQRRSLTAETGSIPVVFPNFTRGTLSIKRQPGSRRPRTALAPAGSAQWDRGIGVIWNYPRFFKRWFPMTSALKAVTMMLATAIMAFSPSEWGHPQDYEILPSKNTDSPRRRPALNLGPREFQLVALTLDGERGVEDLDESQGSVRFAPPTRELSDAAVQLRPPSLSDPVAV